MRKTFGKIAVGLSTAGLIAILLAPVAAADNTIIDNGAGSTNTIVSTQNCESKVKQTNNTNVGVVTTVTSNSGGNTANNNMGDGDVTVTTGAATSSLSVSVSGGSNTATAPDCCDCLSPAADNKIDGNLIDSSNTIVESKTITEKVRQKNRQNVGVVGTVKSKTGKNKANGNGGTGNVTITTNPATSAVGVGVTAPSNTLN